MGTRAPVKRTVEEPRRVDNPYMPRAVPAPSPKPDEVPAPREPDKVAA